MPGPWVPDLDESSAGACVQSPGGIALSCLAESWGVLRISGRLDRGLGRNLRDFFGGRGGDAALADQVEGRGDEQNGRDDDGDDDLDRGSPASSTRSRWRGRSGRYSTPSSPLDPWLPCSCGGAVGRRARAIKTRDAASRPPGARSAVGIPAVVVIAEARVRALIGVVVVIRGKRLPVAAGEPGHVVPGAAVAALVTVGAIRGGAIRDTTVRPTRRGIRRVAARGASVAARAR